MNTDWKTRNLSTLLIALAMLSCFATATQQQNPMVDTDKQLANPSVAHFPIEDLSPAEWQIEHQRMRAALGDKAYLALRKSEIDEKMRSSNAIFNDMIKAGKWRFPTPTKSVQPNRIGLEGRVFNAGVAQGVPEHITYAMYATFDVDDDDRQLPEEWLEFEIPAEVLEDEKKREQEERQKALEMEDAKILAGRYSVRDVDMGCFLESISAGISSQVKEMTSGEE